MTEAVAALSALLQGLRFGVAYNPLAAAIAAAIAAGISGYPRAPRERRVEALGVVALGWLVGDGLRILGHARDLYDGVSITALGGAPEWAGWVFVGTWAFVSLGIGYVVPMLVGATVGRRVTHGTGWLAAMGVALALTVTISAGAGALG
ncbi:MAG: hypothetical protein JW733_04195 [Coriobacteriia bacterium]|nr:hypothetical protein [Coriobacteriia bacterium]MBN2848603.1 hypothetical protein [Coriobacteriia bacterium]